MKFKIFRFKKVKSTNNSAIRIIKNSNIDYGMIIANNQKSGRGQYGKKWISYNGNLFVSFFYKFNNLNASLKQITKINCLLVKKLLSFYYLRIIKIMYFDKEKDKYDTDHGLWLKFSLTLSTLLILIYFVSPSQLIEAVSRINII